VNESVIERERAIRLAAMEWLGSFGFDTNFRYEELAQLGYEGHRVPLRDRGRGIRKPAEMTAALSFTTVYTAPNVTPPYEDAEGPDGLLRYKI
jgi:putative restriction endonuclease